MKRKENEQVKLNTKRKRFDPTMLLTKLKQQFTVNSAVASVHHPQECCCCAAREYVSRYPRQMSVKMSARQSVDVRTQTGEPYTVQQSRAESYRKVVSMIKRHQQFSDLRPVQGRSWFQSPMSFQPEGRDPLEHTSLYQRAGKVLFLF